MSPYLKLLAAPGHLLQLVLQMREPFADLVQDIVQLAIVGVGLVEVCFVSLPLVQSDYAGVSPARQNITALSLCYQHWGESNWNKK